MLTTKRIRELGPGKHGDQNGLLLYVKPAGTRSWVQRLTINRQRVSLGLGPYPAVPLSKARAKALRNKAMVLDGKDPRPPRDMPTFDQLAKRFVVKQRAKWRPNTLRGWTGQLAAISQRIGPTRVDALTIDLLVKTVESAAPTLRTPWLEKIRLVVAQAVPDRIPSNPAEHVRDRLSVVQHVAKHHANVPHGELGDVLRKLPDTEAGRCLKWLAFTVARINEAVPATKAEIDGAVWTIPGTRTKNKTDHRVPLSAPAMALVGPRRRLFTVTDGTVRALAREHGFTPHGLRASFRTWCADTEVSGDLAEMSLSHKVGSQIEQAYQHSDLLPQRAELMQRWADYLAA